MQGPGVAGGIGCAPDLLADLLLGPAGMAGLKRQRPDVYPGNDAEWSEALFPPLTGTCACSTSRTEAGQESA